MGAEGMDILRVMSNQEQNRRKPWVSAVLWILAVVIMFAAADYQEKTGPTKEYKGSFSSGGEEISYALLRSGNTDQDAPILVPNPGGRLDGRLFFKRFPTDDPFSPIPMESVAGELIARRIAMKMATDNAEKMVKSLTLQFNKARQAQITQELAEILGGSEALK